MLKINTLIVHSSNYFYGRLLLMAASFISFPIFTRILTVSEYGILNYVSTLTLLLVAFSKMGLQHSVVRFYPDFKSEKGTYSIAHFYSTLYFAPVILGTIVTCIITFIILAGNRLIDGQLSGFIALMALSIPFQSGISTFTQFLRAEQRVRFFNVINLIERYGSLFFGIAFILLVIKNLWGLYCAWVIWYAIIFSYITLYLYIKKDLSVKCLSLNFLRDAIAYGAPLLGYEFFADILDYGDRLLLKHFMGMEAVAIYSVGYSLPMYIAELFATPLRLAIVPLYIDVWTKNGKEATQEFLSKALSYFALIIIPIIFGTCAVRKEMITLSLQHTSRKLLVL